MAKKKKFVTLPAHRHNCRERRKIPIHRNVGGAEGGLLEAALSALGAMSPDVESKLDI
jgi:hypothetical protein